jgi:hypothetical protein
MTEKSLSDKPLTTGEINRRKNELRKPSYLMRRAKEVAATLESVTSEFESITDIRIVDPDLGMLRWMAP